MALKSDDSLELKMVFLRPAFILGEVGPAKA
jgi:hypothetical protein